MKVGAIVITIRLSKQPSSLSGGMSMVLNGPVVSEFPFDAAIGDLVTKNDTLYMYLGADRWERYVA